MKYPFPDGIIETGISGCCCPPGLNRNGMHTNSSTSWIRLNQGEWKYFRNSTHNRVLLAAAETAEEAFEEITK